MATDYTTGELITGMNVTEYFRDSVGTALAHQQVEASEETVFYVVNLLSHFTRADRLFTHSEDGIHLQPLALMYVQAVDANTMVERQNALRRLGDVALIISGLFAGSLSRKLVDIDYYIAMGGGAYGFLSDMSTGATHGRLFSTIFGELSAKFQLFVDVLAEVSDNAHLGSKTDILRLYEIWARTGSVRVAARLRRLGIEPCAASISRREN